MKKGDLKPRVKAMTKEELKINRQQRKKELKKNRQQTERKDMFDIICQAKQVWGNLRRYQNAASRFNRAVQPVSRPTGWTSALASNPCYHGDSGRLPGGHPVGDTPAPKVGIVCVHLPKRSGRTERFVCGVFLTRPFWCRQKGLRHRVQEKTDDGTS